MEGCAEGAVVAEIEALCSRDHRYEDGCIFNSICSEPLPLARGLFSQYLHTNAGDNRIFPAFHVLEREVTRMLGDLFGLEEAFGGLVSGGTEANFLALVAALRSFREKGGRDPEILAPFSAHYSIEKIAAMLGVSLVKSDLTEGYRVDVEDLRRRITKHTAAIVVTAGSSECGAVDDVPAVAALAAERGVPLHVDAATGGFLIPFARELGYSLPHFDFTLEGVSSMTVDPHKYGYAAIPAGYILFRDEELFRRLDFESHYKGTFNQFSLLGTRPGASVISVYAVLKHLGRAGFLGMVRNLFDKRNYLIDRLQQWGFNLVYPPDLVIVGVAAERPLEMLSYLEKQGQIASVSKRFHFLRIVVQRHLEEQHLDSLIGHMNRFRQMPGGLL